MPLCQWQLRPEASYFWVVHLSHSCEDNISGTPWGNFSNIHLDSRMNWWLNVMVILASCCNHSSCSGWILKGFPTNTSLDDGGQNPHSCFHAIFWHSAGTRSELVKWNWCVSTLRGIFHHKHFYFGRYHLCLSNSNCWNLKLAHSLKRGM